MKKISEMIGKRPLFLLFLFVLLLSFFVKPKETLIEKYIVRFGEGELKGNVQGTIDSITEKENSIELTIKQGVFWQNELEQTSSAKKCPVKKILVYLKKSHSNKENQSYQENSNENSSNQENQNFFNYKIVKKEEREESYQNRKVSNSKVAKQKNIKINYQNQEVQKKRNSNAKTTREKIVESDNLGIGNLIQLQGTISIFQKPTNLGQFNEYDYYKAKKYDCKMYADSSTIVNERVTKWKEWIRQLKLKSQAIYESQLPNTQAGVVEAMVLGEKENLDSEIKMLYQKNGIGHIMAISGLHISFWGMGVYRLFKQLRFGETLSSFLSIGVIFFYGIVTGCSVSAIRAVVMLTLALLAPIVGRTYDMLSAMAFSGIITLICCPLQVRASGFLLSYGAIIGIGLCYPILKEVVSPKIKTKSKFVITLTDSFLVTISIQLVLFPITAFFYYEIPLYGSVLNLVVLPVMSLLLTTSIIGLVFSLIHPLLGKFIFGTVHVILLYYEILCKAVIKLPFSTIIIGKPSIIRIILYSVLVVGILCFLEKKRETKLLFLLPLCFFAFFSIPIKQFEATMLDVGQGDSIFLTTGKTSYLMDGGSSNIKQVGAYRILPFLKAKGVQTLDYMIVSHTDSDHINGLVELLEEEQKSSFRVRYLILPKLSNSLEDKAYKKLENLANEGKTKIYYIERGMKWKKEKLEVTCLHPNKDFLVEDKNECSMILSMKYGSLRFLFTGDVEKEGEKEILPYLGEHDILKVAHHGSDSSSTEQFLERVKPKLALISCALHNRYGHPSKDVVERMKEQGAMVYNTSLNGAITIWSNGKKVRVKKTLDS